MEVSAPFAVEHHERIDSTNDRARTLAERGERGVAVVADEQTGGRGRRGRSWGSPPGGAYVSVVLDPGLPTAETPLLTLAGAVAVCEACDPLIDPRIKWPNDVLHEGNKLSGILTERVSGTERVVLGMGINANVDETALPDRATTLQAAVGEPINRTALVERLLTALDAHVTTPDGILPAWRERADTLGRSVRVATPDGPVVGEAVDVVRPGALVVDTGEERVRIDAGDCEHLRPAEER